MLWGVLRKAHMDFHADAPEREPGRPAHSGSAHPLIGGGSDEQWTTFARGVNGQDVRDPCPLRMRVLDLCAPAGRHVDLERKYADCPILQTSEDTSLMPASGHDISGPDAHPGWYPDLLRQQLMKIRLNKILVFKGYGQGVGLRLVGRVGSRPGLGFMRDHNKKSFIVISEGIACSPLPQLQRAVREGVAAWRHLKSAPVLDEVLRVIRILLNKHVCELVRIDVTVDVQFHG